MLYSVPQDCDWSFSNISQLVWLLAFAALIVVWIQTENKDQLPSKFNWWAVVYDLFVILGVFVIVASDTIHTYHVALTGYCACGISMTSLAVHNLIYSDKAAQQASAAGFILLSMLMVSNSTTDGQKYCTNQHRLSGHSTLDLRLLQLPELSSIHSP